MTTIEAINHYNGMPYVGDVCGYSVYKNASGFLEGYIGVGRNKYHVDPNQHGDVKRVVTNQTTLEGFAAYVSGLKPKPEPKPSYENQKEIDFL